MINVRKSKPKNYHCNCSFCKKFYKGELIQENGEYYSSRNRIGYSEVEKKIKHLCPGHWQQYQFVIENFTKKNDTVFDPMAGSGTALIEAAKLGRKGIGIELEFFKVLKANCEQYNNLKILWGDARKAIDKIKDSFDLIVTGPVYNNNSDSPERKNLTTKEDKTFNYKNEENLAFLKDKEYYEQLELLYRKCIAKLKKGKKFIIIIKDTVRNKKAYLLHRNISKILIDKCGLKMKAVYVCYHYPPTMFMNTYNKRFPNVKIPKFQTICVLEK